MVNRDSIETVRATDRTHGKVGDSIVDKRQQYPLSSTLFFMFPEHDFLTEHASTCIASILGIPMEVFVLFEIGRGFKGFIASTVVTVKRTNI